MYRRSLILQRASLFIVWIPGLEGGRGGSIPPSFFCPFRPSGVLAISSKTSSFSPYSPEMPCQHHQNNLSVANTNEVVGESLNGLRGITGLDVLAVVTDKDGLFRLDDGDTLLLMATVDVVTLNSSGDVALAGNVEAVGEGLIGLGLLGGVFRGLVKDGDDMLDLIGADLRIYK